MKKIVLVTVLVLIASITWSQGKDFPSPTGIKMLYVEGGTFQMGSNDGEDNEKPVHSVTVSDFYIGKYPVTVKEFSDFIGSSGYKTTAEEIGTVNWFEGSTLTYKSGITWRDDVQGNRRGSNEYNHPVLYVTWYDAIEYCNWLSSKEGLAPVYSIDKSRHDPNNKSSYDKLKWTVSVN